MVNTRKETPYKARKKREILEYIFNYRRYYRGRSPTYAEIGRKVGISSQPVYQYYLRELIDDQWLFNEDGIARSLVPVSNWEDYPIPEETSA